MAFGFWLMTLKYSLVLAGFFFVPAFFGETVVVSVADCVVWAMATAERARAVSAARATIRVLRKRSPPQESSMRFTRNTARRRESFA